MDDDIDPQLRRSLGSVRLATPPADRREEVRRAARRRRRTRAGLAGAGGIAAVAALVAVGLRDRGMTVRTDLAGPAGEQVVEVGGLGVAVRISETFRPVADAEAYGAVPLAGGAITGATQTTLDGGSATVLLAVTPGARTSRIDVTGDGLAAPVVQHVDGPVLLEVDLEERDPLIVLDVTALDEGGEALATARIAPFIQDPLACHTYPESVGADGPAPPTFMRHLGAYLAAPVLPVCDR